MKIIDLLNKIANGEMEETLFYVNGDFFYDLIVIDKNLYVINTTTKKLELLESKYISRFVRDNVELLRLDNFEKNLEEQKKQVKPLTKKDIEALGYACGEIQKCFTNGWTKSLENKPLEEQKKIPEKLTDILRVDDLIPPVDENMYKILTQIIKNQNKINSLIDYLKSKGE